VRGRVSSVKYCWMICSASRSGSYSVSAFSRFPILIGPTVLVNGLSWFVW